VLASGLQHPTLLAVDARRNVYVYSAPARAVYVIRPDGHTRLAADISTPLRSLAVDRDGNLLLLGEGGVLERVRPGE